MPATAWKKSPPALVERFTAALPAHPHLVRRPMFGYPAAFVNGNMICSLFQNTVIVRLGKEGAAAALAAGQARQFAPIPGRAMTGYVVLPDPDAKDRAALAAALERALEYTLTLPKKPPKARPAKTGARKARRKR